MAKRYTDETTAEVAHRLREKLMFECAEKAIDALTDVAADKNAPAPARATAGTAILRSAGFFEKGETGPSSKQLHEMTGEELQAEVARIRRKLSDADPEDSGVFG